MANDRVLRATVTIDAKKGIETLKQVEKQGNQTVTTIMKNGELMSRSITNITGQTATAAIKTNTAWTALNTTWSAGIAIANQLAASGRVVVQAINASADAARQDEQSMIARNAALGTLTGATDLHAQALENQAKHYLKTYGIADDYTRAIQREMAELRVAPDLIDEATDATVKLGVSSQAVARFLTDQTDKIKGTTIAVDENATAQQRLQALLDGTAGKAAALESQLDTATGSTNRMKAAWDELNESLGAAFTTSGFISSTNNMADAVIRLSELINGTIGAINMMGGGSGKGWWSNVDWRSPFSAGVTGILNSPWMKGANMGLNLAMGMANPQRLPGDTSPDVQPVFGPPGGGGGKAKGGAKAARDLWAEMMRSAGVSDWGDQIGLGGAADSIRNRAGLIANPRARANQYRSAIAMLTGDGTVHGLGSGPMGGRPRTMDSTGLEMGGIIDRIGGGYSFDRLSDAVGIKNWQLGQMRNRDLPEAKLNRMQLIGNQFNGQGIAALAGSVLGGGGIRGFLGTAGALAGNAFGPLGSALGGIVGGGLGKLLGGIFGGGRKRDEDRGLVPGKPIYVEDQQLRDEIARLGNIIRVNLLGGGGSNIDMANRNFALQRARAGG